MENNEYVFRCNNIVKRYKDFRALDGLSMNVRKGEIYGFVGENGSGKTTIIRLITGLIFQNEGEFELFGVSSKDKNAICEARRNIGAIVETPSIYQGFSLKDNMLLQGLISNNTNPDKIKEVLELVGLYSLYNDKRRVLNYSLGMRQRLGLAMALLKEPKFIILDEPMNGLDPEGVVAMRNLILDLNQRRGITFLISSHILTELDLIATSYGIISHGKMVKEVTKEEVHQELKSKTYVEVSDISKAVELLLPNYNISVDLNKIVIEGKIEKRELFNLLFSNGVEVIDIQESHSSIEEYYINTLRGAQHDNLN
ncbi:MAG: ABC transporter ATP-binding protein [Acholeplasmatales bacterium]|nr:ABC transporter ATP-binding protein [Acholeplasmatales bacterium]